MSGPPLVRHVELPRVESPPHCLTGPLPGAVSPGRVPLTAG
ncbi:hypothetical protein [Streptosporangium sp. KLBMP 9127]